MKEIDFKTRRMTDASAQNDDGIAVAGDGGTATVHGHFSIAVAGTTGHAIANTSRSIAVIRGGSRGVGLHATAQGSNQVVCIGFENAIADSGNGCVSITIIGGIAQTGVNSLAYAASKGHAMAADNSVAVAMDPSCTAEAGHDGVMIFGYRERPDRYNFKVGLVKGGSLKDVKVDLEAGKKYKLDQNFEIVLVDGIGPRREKLVSKRAPRSKAKK